MAVAKQPPAYDVWLLAADTVYKGVPTTVVADWAGSGRLAKGDKIRPAGTEAWQFVGAVPFIAGFLFRGGNPTGPGVVSDTAEQLQPIEFDLDYHPHVEDEETDVDMIPLIDVSLVLLVFFMMTASVATLSPVPVPDMKNASELHKDPDAMTISIDKRGADEVIFSLRIGDKPPQGEDNNLTTPEQVLARLDVRLKDVQRPPEVRIACNKEVQRGYVRDIARELDKRKQKEQIAFYGAEVNEKK